jgi:hypothetical protein
MREGCLAVFTDDVGHLAARKPRSDMPREQRRSMQDL